MIKGLAEIEGIVKSCIEQQESSRFPNPMLSRFKTISANLTEDLGVRVYEMVCEYSTFPPHPRDPRKEFFRIRAVSGEIIAHKEI